MTPYLNYRCIYECNSQVISVSQHFIPSPASCTLSNPLPRGFLSITGKIPLFYLVLGPQWLHTPSTLIRHESGRGLLFATYFLSLKHNNHPCEGEREGVRNHSTHLHPGFSSQRPLRSLLALVGPQNPINRSLPSDPA